MNNKDPKKRLIPSVNANEEVNDLDAFEDCCTLSMETKDLSPLDSALESWEGCLRVVAVETKEKLRCVMVSLEMMHVLAWIYKLAGRVRHEKLFCLCLCYSIKYNNNNNSTLCQTTTIENFK